MNVNIESTARSSEFEDRLLARLVKDRFNFHEDNYDFFFKGPLPPDQQSGILNKFKLQARGSRTLWEALKSLWTYRFEPQRYFRSFLEESKKYAFFYEQLADSTSRELLISLLAYRALGFRRIKLDRNNTAYWQGIELSKTLDTGRPEMRIPFLTWPLKCFDVRSLGFEMDVYTYAEAIAINFVQKQYVLEREGVSCKAETGDVVIDAGGCWGDTALQFACEVGATGHVYSFEFVPSNLTVFQKNLEINPHLQSRISLVQNPVGAVAGNKMFFYENGPGSRAATHKINDRYFECSIETIDNLVLEKNLNKIDFIKMDVEGSELDALKGAEQTLRRFRPKLAICIYHKPDDYLTIPKYLNDLNLGYRFYVDHHTIYLNETVLFAVPDSRV